MKIMKPIVTKDASINAAAFSRLIPGIRVTGPNRAELVIAY